MKVEQYVMAYGAEQDRLRAMLPEGFSSLRPVLRINAEIRQYEDGQEDGYVEFNTAAEKDGNKGWLNITYWDGINFTKEGSKTTFSSDFLEISFTGVGIEGSCPAEKDCAGCYFIKETPELQPPEVITARKEFCDCSFRWKFADADAHGESVGDTFPAYPESIETVYPKEALTAQNAAAIPCRKVLGSYKVSFER